MKLTTNIRTCGSRAREHVDGVQAQYARLHGLHDATLRKIAKCDPALLHERCEPSGGGEKKLEIYSEEIIMLAAGIND